MRRRVLIGIVCASALISGCPFPRPGPHLPPGASDGIRLIAEQRSKAGDWARILQREWSKTTPAYRQGEALYIDARAAFNGWIEQLKLDLQAGRRLDQSSQYQQTLQRAVDKSEAFIRHVSEHRSSYHVAAFPIADLIVGLTDAGIKVWQEWQRADQAQQERLKRELDGQKWRPFDQLST